MQKKRGQGKKKKKGIPGATTDPIKKGVRVGYLSETANVGSDSKRLHSDKDSLKEEKAEDNHPIY